MRILVKENLENSNKQTNKKVNVKVIENDHQRDKCEFYFGFETVSKPNNSGNIEIQNSINTEGEFYNYGESEITNDTPIMNFQLPDIPGDYIIKVICEFVKKIDITKTVKTLDENGDLITEEVDDILVEREIIKSSNLTLSYVEDSDDDWV